MFDEVTKFQRFWASVRMAMLNRQPGLTWNEAGGMDIEDFFNVLKLSEKNTESIDKKLRSKKN